MIAVRLKRNPYCGYLRTGTEYWRNLILSLGYISHIWGLHFRIYKTYPCLLASFCLCGWEVALWILVEIFMRDLFPCLQHNVSTAKGNTQACTRNATPIELGWD